MCIFAVLNHSKMYSLKSILLLIQRCQVPVTAWGFSFLSEPNSTAIFKNFHYVKSLKRKHTNREQ